MGDIVCLNGMYMQGSEATISVSDEGVLYGMGIFETIRIIKSSPKVLDRHLSRLFASAEKLGLGIPWKYEEIANMVARTAAVNGMVEGGLRLTLTAGGIVSGPSIFIQIRKVLYREEQYCNGISAGFASIRRNETSTLVNHKTINYYENILARRKATVVGWGEVLFLNTSGNLAEGSVSNIFLVNGGKIITPGEQCGILPGITRQRVINICKAMQLPLEVRSVQPSELTCASECFVTNSLMGVMPLVLIGDMTVGNGLPGEITRMIMIELGKEKT